MSSHGRSGLVGVIEGGLKNWCAYHKKFDDVPVDQYLLVTSLMAGIFNSRLPQPRYIFLCLGCSNCFKRY